MHRDLKLGLALAVLLIGSTTAFFFRGNPDQSKGLPQLDKLEGHGISAESEGVFEFNEVVSEDAGDAESRRSFWTKPAFLNGTVAAASRSGVTPDPIPVLGIIGGEETVTTASQRDDASTENRNGIVEVDGLRFHVVQPGDTLSGLAAQYLGSIARFEELYELNRDVLRGPHDLKIGMKLRLPQPRTEPTTATPRDVPVIQASSNNSISLGGPTSADAATPSPSDAQEIKLDADSIEPRSPTEKLFVPAKRTPFIPSRYRSPKKSAAAEGSTTVGRE